MRAADPPGDERTERLERTRAVIRTSGAELAASIEADRKRLDRNLRVAGFAMLVFGVLLVLARVLDFPRLWRREGSVAGAAILVGPMLMVLGSQGAAQLERLPVWMRAALAVAAGFGILLGMALSY